MKVRLSQAAEVRLGRQRSPQHESGDHVISYLRSANVVDGALDLSDVKQMNFEPDEQLVFSLERGDVLMTEGSGSRDTVGTSAVWEQELSSPICFQNTLLRLRPREGVTDGRFLAWWARHARLSGQIAAISSGANILHVGSDGLKGLSIQLPSVLEQRRIADFLDGQAAQIDRIVADRRHQLALAAECRASAADSALADSWTDQTTLRRFILNIEQGWSPQCDGVPAGPDEWGVLKLSAIRPGQFRSNENKRLPDDLEPQTHYQLRSGDLLMTRASTPAMVGMCAVVPEDVRPGLLLCDKIMRIQLSDAVDAEYVSLLASTQRVRDHLSAAGTGTSQSMVNIRGEDVRNAPIPDLPASRQHAIVTDFRATIADVNLVERGLTRSIDLLTEYKASLITAAVTGELDVTTAGSGIPA